MSGVARVVSHLNDTGANHPLPLERKTMGGWSREDVQSYVTRKVIFLSSDPMFSSAYRTTHSFVTSSHSMRAPQFAIQIAVMIFPSTRMSLGSLFEPGHRSSANRTLSPSGSTTSLLCSGSDFVKISILNGNTVSLIGAHPARPVGLIHHQEVPYRKTAGVSCLLLPCDKLRSYC